MSLLNSLLILIFFLLYLSPSLASPSSCLPQLKPPLERDTGAGTLASSTIFKISSLLWTEKVGLSSLCYGILVLEMMMGKKPIDSLFEAGLNLHNNARMASPNQIVEIVDPKLIGVASSMESPQDHMLISIILRELPLIKSNLQRNRGNY
ncbi:hypothetical protein SLEP1_g31198 [Rubroshorea leprosula]|uniref:Uncharacterized protein n=1 Tax=Rubroshorea leprosula TaxID=152421 RepID=A0AAV5K7U7_9ROSI|nr:hypothetical protein SLEP1_g31198 [Rubroshorea leprosula]